jgi:hypothetical protein
MSNHLPPTESNIKYEMIRKEVQVHNLRVYIKQLARTAVALRVPAITLHDGTQAAFDHRRGKLANDYEAYALELIDRATKQARRAIADSNQEFSGGHARVLEARLHLIIAAFSADPFVDLNDDHTKLYIDLTNDERLEFWFALWFARYNTQVVGWY